MAIKLVLYGNSLYNYALYPRLVMLQAMALEWQWKYGMDNYIIYCVPYQQYIRRRREYYMTYITALYWLTNASTKYTRVCLVLHCGMFLSKQLCWMTLELRKQLLGSQILSSPSYDTFGLYSDLIPPITTNLTTEECNCTLHLRSVARYYMQVSERQLRLLTQLALSQHQEEAQARKETVNAGYERSLKGRSTKALGYCS